MLLPGATTASGAEAATNPSKGRGRSWFRKRSGQQQEAADAAAAAAAAPPLTGEALVGDTWRKLAIALPWKHGSGSNDYYCRLLERSKCAVDSLYSDFARQAERQGWKLGSTMLNPREARLVKLQLTV
jgi:hypothetical protein